MSELEMSLGWVGLKRKRKYYLQDRIVPCVMYLFMLDSWTPRVQALNYLQVHHVPLIFLTELQQYHRFMPQRPQILL